MALEKTFAIIKPDAVNRHLIGAILSRIEQAGFCVAASKMLHLTRTQAEGFYAEHQAKAFFPDLVDYMISAPVVVLVLEKENAVKDYRALIGKTDPTEANPGTIRHDFALNYRQNAVHGSDSIESAQREIAYFFVESEIF